MLATLALYFFTEHQISVTPKVPVYFASATRKTGPHVEQNDKNGCNHRSARSHSLSLMGTLGVENSLHLLFHLSFNRDSWQQQMLYLVRLDWEKALVVL